MDKHLFSKIPAVNVLLQSEQGKALIADFSHAVVVAAIREVTDRFRAGAFNIADESELHPTLIAEAKRFLQAKFTPSLKRCINATGTVIHTNLGRAKLSRTITAELLDAAFENTNLEYDVASGRRGSRYQHLEKTLCELTGAEAALVVNNNAAAVMLVLDTMAKTRDVIVSRGELVEIGGSFRIPEIIALSGCHLKEVGTTNKTHIHDYVQAMDEAQTAAILKVHTSNYKISGFTKSVEIEALATISKENNVPLIHDMGSGMLIDLQKYGLPYEMTVQESLKAGADVITFSGDKVLGGPQAGVIVGKKRYIDAMKKNQLTRALRVDKLTIATLEATLRLYYDETQALAKIPTLDMLCADLTMLAEKATALMLEISQREISGVDLEMLEVHSQVGGGAYPGEILASQAVGIYTTQMSASELAEKLRQANVPIICKIRNERCEFDVRTIERDEFSVIADILCGILA